MRVRLVCCLIALVFLPLAAARGQDLTLDEILRKNMDAIGGAEAIARIQSLKLVGHSVMAGSGMEVSMIVMTKRPNLVRMEMTFQGQHVTMGYDGAAAWMFTGNGEPRKITDQEASRLKETSMDTSIGTLAGLKAAGHTLELLGKEDAAGGPAYKIKVTMKGGLVATYYLDAASFLPVRTIATVNSTGQEMEVESFPTGYKRVGGIMFAHTIDQRVGGSSIGQMTYEKIETNEPMDDEIFRMPGSGASAVKK